MTDGSPTPWPLWRRVVAYVVLAAVAAVSVWLVDRDAMRVGQEPVTTPAGARP